MHETQCKWSEILKAYEFNRLSHTRKHEIHKAKVYVKCIKRSGSVLSDHFEAHLKYSVQSISTLSSLFDCLVGMISIVKPIS